jgi:hypothetical protein
MLDDDIILDMDDDNDSPAVNEPRIDDGHESDIERGAFDHF